MYRNLYLLASGCLCLLGVFFLTFNGRARRRADYAWNNTTEPQTLDPTRMSAQPEGALALALFEGLTVYHPEDLSPLPGVARSVRGEGLTLIFDLREDAYWVKRGEVLRGPGGAPRRVTAGDFVWTWRRHLLPEVGSEYSHLLRAVRGAEEFEREAAAQWKATVEMFQRKHGRAPGGVQDLDPDDRRAVEEFREAKWAALVGIRAAGDGRLIVELRASAPWFLHLTSFYPLMPVCREAVEEHGERWVLPENMVSDGPYWLEEWQFNSSLRLRKNVHYWETEEHAARRIGELERRPSLEPMESRELDLLRRFGSFAGRGLETLEALSVEELNTALNLYLTGGIDYQHQIPPEVARELIEESRRPGTGFHHLHHGPALTFYFFNLNNSLEVFRGEAGRKLRRALALCVDRRTITEAVTRAFQRPAYRFVPPGIPGYPQAPLLGSGDFEADAREAARLADEVRRERGSIPRLRILYNSSEANEKIAAHVQSVWRSRLGIEVDLANQEWGAFLDARRSGDFDIARAGWIADYPDPNTFLDIFTTSNQNNDTRYSSPLYDRLVLDSCARTAEVLGDAAERKGLLDSIEASPCFAAIRDRRREDGRTLWEAVLGAAAGFEAAGEADRPPLALEARSLLFEVAEEVLVADLPAIPVFFYTSTQLWPPELEGMALNQSDYHPPKFLRWKGGKRPEGRRLADFPRFSARDRGAPPAGGPGAGGGD